jgi:hypothetical protein
MVVETPTPPRPAWTKGTRVIMAFSCGDTFYSMRGVVSEAVTPRRCYIIPRSAPVAMEKREYIRALLAIPAVVTLLDRKPVRGRTPDKTSVELSASGFRWFAPLDVEPGAHVRLRCEVEAPVPRKFDLTAVVVRSRRDGDRGEVAGMFEDISQEDREALVETVFHSRLCELGMDACADDGPV